MNPLPLARPTTSLKTVVGLVLLHLTVAAVPGLAQITPIASPFTGTALETWEEYPVDYPPTPTSLFGGLATIDGGNPFVWKTTYSFDTPGGLGLGPFTAKAIDGTHGYVTSVSPGMARITFHTPVTDFGGYWGYAVGYEPAQFTFRNAQGSLIGNALFTYTAPNYNGTLEWQGWHSAVPIASVDYYGHWLANDSLRITTIPEPAAGVLLAAASAALALHRRRGKRPSGH